jgi:MPBQ/MSBQ methyltransferase
MTDTMQSHYGREGIVERILKSLADDGVDIDHLQVDHLGALDEFHVGRRDASERLLPLLGVGAGDAILDVGSGIGGPARFLAERTGASVIGIDLTPEFVDAATELTRRVGLADRVSFQLASGTDIPFDDDRFDAATLMHVGMNIEDKDALIADMARVTRPGGTILVYDLMRVGPGALEHPMPWASLPQFSFVDPPDRYEAAARAAGLVVVERTDHGDLARAFFDRAAETPPRPHPAGGEDPRRVASLRNAAAAVRSGTITPIALVLKHG